jgi:GT2 family glycosyltransferase
MDKFHKISIVICTYSFDRYQDTIETINSLNKQTYHNKEIILVIDRNINLYNDFNKSVDLISLKNLKIGLSSLPGLSNARNRGVELATGDIIAFIDDDAIADENWVFNLINCYDSPDVIGAGGPMKPLWIFGVAKWIPEEFYWTMGCSYKNQGNVFHYVRSNFGSNMSFRKSVFEKVGKFDDQFGLIGSNMKTGEETEFSIRALNYFTDGKIAFNPEAVVFHKIFKFRKSFFFLIKRCYSYGYAIANIGSSKEKIDKKLVSTESSFLKYLLNTSFSERIKNIVVNKDAITNLLHIFALLILTMTVGMGFVIKKIINLKQLVV